jgi:hypothetical protein
MGVVTGSTANLHVAQLSAKQVRGALEQRLSLLDVTPETSLFNIWPGEHVYRQSSVKNLRNLGFGLFRQVQGHSLDQFWMVDAVTRQAAHVPAVVLPANPFTMRAFSPVTDETGLICIGSAEGRRVDGSWSRFCLGTIFRVLVAIAVAGLALGVARIGQEHGALAVSVKGKGLYDQPVTLLAILANDGLLNGATALSSWRVDGLRIYSRLGQPRQTDCARNAEDRQYEGDGDSDNSQAICLVGFSHTSDLG